MPDFAFLTIFYRRLKRVRLIIIDADAPANVFILNAQIQLNCKYKIHNIYS